jgi:hypothetical protein
MNLDESGPVERKDVERAAERWAHRSYRNASSHGPEQTDEELRRFASCFTDYRDPELALRLASS